MERKTDEKTGGSSAGLGKGKELVKRTVIDEELLEEAVREDFKYGHDPAVPLVEPNEKFELREVKTIILSFKDIAKIDNLQGFSNLTKLQLDNNVIDTIENLGHLVNLTWLDLSFNNITKIENLGSLTKLTDLSLADNHIEVIEGLDNLTNLEVLSLGNNNISDLDSIRELRKFRRLRLLNLKGNPMETDDPIAYRARALALLCQLRTGSKRKPAEFQRTNLQYLDYKLIEEAEVKDAKDRLGDTLMLATLEKEEDVQQEDVSKDLQRAQLAQVDRNANLDGVRELFDQMLREDSEHTKLKLLPQFDKSVLKPYRKDFLQNIKRFRDNMVRLQRKKEIEQTVFEKVMEAANAKTERLCREKVTQFNKRKREDVATYVAGRGHGDAERNILKLLQEECDKLLDALMELEMLTVEQNNELINKFDKAYNQLKTACTQEIESTFHELEDVAGGYGERLHTLVNTLTKDFESKASVDKDLSLYSTEVEHLLGDKSQLKESIATSQENHVSKIFAKNEELKNNERNRTGALLARVRKAEYERNRHRVAEIYELVENHKHDIADRLDADADDEDYASDADD